MALASVSWWHGYRVTTTLSLLTRGWATRCVAYEVDRDHPYDGFRDPPPLHRSATVARSVYYLRVSAMGCFDSFNDFSFFFSSSAYYPGMLTSRCLPTIRNRRSSVIIITKIITNLIIRT